jgi:hypothetical protein
MFWEGVAGEETRRLPWRLIDDVERLRKRGGKRKFGEN